MRKKAIKLKRWRIRVYQDHIVTSQDYIIIAVDAMDARIIAFALNNGFAYTKTCMDEDDIELVKTYTEII
jgi:hypothetical protein